MEFPSAFSSFYPTSSSTLAQHSCVRLLWLPLSTCLKMAGEHIRSLSTSSSLPPLSHQSVTDSFSHGAGGVGSLGQPVDDADDELVSGFEMRLKHACAHAAAAPMSQFRESFIAPDAVKLDATGAPRAAVRVGVPPALPPHFREDARLRFLIGDDAGASQWENMEAHRVISAVIVVVNASCSLSLPLNSVLSVVKTVLDAQYKDKVCRCYVVSGKSSLADVQKAMAGLPPRTFVAVDPSRPVEETARAAMEDIGRNIVFSLNVALNVYDGYIATLSAKGSRGRVDLTTLRTPLDILTSGGVGGGSVSNAGSGSSGGNGGALDTIKSSLLISRFSKKRGDILVQLGATDAALRAYGETQFASNADALWCSATLEAIAAARYQQWHEQLVPQLARISESLLALQSDETDWTKAEPLTAQLTRIEDLVQRMCTLVQRAVAQLKGPCVPQSMRQRLTREIDERLSAELSKLRTLLARARACVEAGTNELESDAYAYRVGRDLKSSVEEMLRAGLLEIDVYLKESLRQQRHATTTANKKTLQDRDLETRLKSVAFLVDRGVAEAFLAELAEVRGLFSVVYGDDVQKVLRFFAFLCVAARCRRKATALLVEAAHNDRRGKLYAGAIQSLVRACYLSGVALGGVPELNAAVLVDPLCRAFTVAAASRSASVGLLSALVSPQAASGGGDQAANTLCSATSALWQQASTAEPARGTAAIDVGSVFSNDERKPSQGTSKLNELVLASRTMRWHIPLLMELLDVLHEADCRGNVRCQLATLLLFRYPAYLDRHTAQLLTDIARAEALRLEPHVRPATAALPFLTSWEALPLPPHLAPKTVSVGGPQFTFIDTQRLKLTILSLNGRKLSSRVVWTVGDVGSVAVLLHNPYPWPVRLVSLSLQSRACSDLDDSDALPPGAVSHTVGPLAPTSYVLFNVALSPLARTRVVLQVQPKMEGFLRIEGVEMRLDHLKGATLPVRGPLPEPMGIPVLQQLPLVSCTISVSELEIFSGQSVEFTVRVVNCGQLPIAHISLTAHGEACLLEDCEGCKERATTDDIRVMLNKAALEAAARAPLRPGDVVTIPVKLIAPKRISEMESHFLVFRVDCVLPHARPTMPPHVPSAVPVFGVIPRRVTETRMRIFHAPTLAVVAVRLTRDKRFVDVRVVNRSERHTVELALRSLPFAELPNALLMAGADYVVPPLDIARVSEDGKLRGSFIYEVPWAVREIPGCAGTLALNLSLVAEEAVCAEPLDEVLVAMDVILPTDNAGNRYLSARHWESRPPPLGSAARRDRLCRRHRRHTHAHRGRRHMNNSDHCGESDGAGDSAFVVPSRSQSHTTPRSPASSSRSSTYSSSARSGYSSAPSAGTSATSPADLNPQGASSSCTARAYHSKTERAARGKDDDHALDTNVGTAASALSAMPILLPAVTPVRLRLQVSAPWRRAVPLHVGVSMPSHMDVGVLSGPVDSASVVGDGGCSVCDQTFELLAFKTGQHALSVTIRDPADREITHVIPFIVQHDRD